MKIDFHVHSLYSDDGVNSVPELALAAKKMGLEGLAICDHNVLTPRHDTKGFFVLYGQEVSTKQGHLCVFGVGDKFEKGSDVFEVVDIARSEGALIIAPHPFSPRKNSLREFAERIKPDALEQYNGFDFISNIIAMEKRVHGLGGSDAHSVFELANAFTILDCEPNEDDVISAVRKKHFHAIWATRPITYAQRIALRIEEKIDDAIYLLRDKKKLEEQVKQALDLEQE